MVTTSSAQRRSDQNPTQTYGVLAPRSYRCLLSLSCSVCDIFHLILNDDPSPFSINLVSSCHFILILVQRAFLFDKKKSPIYRPIKCWLLCFSWNSFFFSFWISWLLCFLWVSFLNISKSFPFGGILSVCLYTPNQIIIVQRTALFSFFSWLTHWLLCIHTSTTVCHNPGQLL